MSESSRWFRDYDSRKYSTSTRTGRSPISKTRVGNGNGYEGNENGSYQYVRIDEKKFRNSDHRESSAYQAQRSLIRAKILEEVVDDVFRKHYFPVTKENTIVFEYDRIEDEIKEAVIDWKKQRSLPKKWLMDTGRGHDLIGRAKAKSLGVHPHLTWPIVVGERLSSRMCWMRHTRYCR